MTVDRHRLFSLATDNFYWNGRYHNPEHIPQAGLRDFIAWQWRTGFHFPEKKPQPWCRPEMARLQVPTTDRQLTWLGHACFLVQVNGINTLTDPIFSERCSPWQFMGPKRFTPAVIRVDELPEIHRVVISHNHYDHLDEATVVALARRFPEVRFLVPQGVAQWFAQRNIPNVDELGWWQSVELGEAEEAFCLPVQHFSGRTLRDRNRTLWCSWLLRQHDRYWYFAGDTGYGKIFGTLGEIFSQIDLALLPIGAYNPRELAAAVHVNPEEAVRIHQDLRARQSVAMHWGTFALTLEPVDEPPKKLAEALAAAAVDPSAFAVFDQGETRAW